MLCTMNYPILTIFQQMSSISLLRFVNFIAKNLDRKMILAPFKSGDTFMKDPIPKSLESFVVYKFVFLDRNT